ncbi:MAG: type IV pilin N-terminal domain-containing protein [Methanomicrobiales archaeon]
MKLARNCTAVSPVIGEMLMLSMVLILIAVASSSVFSLLPAERSPSVTIMLTNTTDNLTLWHKGGDWIDRTDISVLVMNETAVSRFRYSDFVLVPDTQVFDLGSTITVDINCTGVGEVRLVTPRAVVFSGKMGG